jgi:hypothetical protein
VGSKLRTLRDMTILMSQFFYFDGHSIPSLYHSLHSCSDHNVLINAELGETGLLFERVNCLIRYTERFEPIL